MAFAFDFKDESQVQEYLDRLHTEFSFQCYKEKDSEGCHRLADLFDMRSRDYSQAGKVYRMNCLENDYGHSCYKYASYCLGNKGQSPDENQASVVRFLDKGCDVGHWPSCSVSGSYHLAVSQGLGSGQPGSRGPSCSVNEAEKCKHKTLGLSQLANACENKQARACSSLSTYFLQQAQLMVDQQAQNHLAQGQPMQGHHVQGHIVESQPVQGQTPQSMTSEGHHDASSDKLQSPIEHSQLADLKCEQPMAKAFRYALRACELQDAQSCANVSIMYRRGVDGAPSRDLDAARRYRIMAKRLSTKAQQGDTSVVFGLTPNSPFRNQA